MLRPDRSEHTVPVQGQIQVMISLKRVSVGIECNILQNGPSWLRVDCEAVLSSVVERRKLPLWYSTSKDPLAEQVCPILA